MDAPPTRLAAVLQFVNTRGTADEPDVLGGAAPARAWLDAMMRPSVPVDDASLTRLRELREALHLTLQVHNDLCDHRTAAAALAPLCVASNLGLIVGRGSALEVTGTGDGLDGFVNDALAVVAIAAIDGTWLRLKACAEPSCGRAFWDGTRNQAQRFCSTARCANRARQRAFRERRRQLS